MNSHPISPANQSTCDLPNDIDRLADELSQQLLPSDSTPSTSKTLPPWMLNRDFGCEMAPHLAYGRHRGPHRCHSRHAAVAVCLFQDPSNGSWTIPLTRRPTTLRHHGGQICFPGGRIERGETPPDAALREFEEELGGAARVHRCCGNLPRQYVYASDNLVTPIVFVIDPPDQNWQPDPVEVDEVIDFPIQTVLRQTPAATSRQSQAEKGCQFDMIQQTKVLRSATCPDRVAGHLKFAAPAFQHGSVHVWGATAIILGQLAQALHPV
ncbi:NUDIX hydrolase [Rhodopirellula bahusiensis]|uniref:NUDIX hydrolase n=1 Tax=Rhodopirellula bahusiensis TaxID=2014065 RepID=UPI0018EC2211|nr:CoA pyrophosphatase [Rhodopirellula bahusiensis]